MTKSQAKAAGFVKKFSLQIAVLAGFIAIWAIFFTLNPKVFSSPMTYGAILVTVPIYIILALPLTYVTISGEIDLSFGSVTAISGMVFAVTLISTDNPLLGLMLSLIVCTLVGASIGFLVAKVALPSMILTLGMMFFLRGMIYVLTGGNSMGIISHMQPGFTDWLVGELRVGEWPIPVQLLWAVLFATLAWLFLNRHVYGAHLYYVGNNENSARLRGINVGNVKMTAYAIVGLACSISGIMAVLINKTFFATLGDGYLLPVLAMVFVGSTPPKGGTGTIFGTFVGGMIIGIIDSGLIAAGGVGYWTRLFFGLVIILSIAIFKVLRRT